ncbi:MAG: chromosome segregation protein SMC [Clostridia bacterium]|nr:chromosome segregation protein SMC [Clostridia bacterium]
MYLKRLELQGFKSFPEKIRLEFNKGITVVVGPNGSGKSNIADAVRWVLGEKSAKSLRGAKMEDVIFNGTANRKPMGFAEVSMVMDNTDRTLNMDFSEVTVTRRVYRSGDSDYLINGSNCRLKDILELFMDTGVGKEGYSIIGQGRIDEILSTKSEDRRMLFEEAAGIVKYKTRRAEAANKLEKEHANLVRVNDIIAELETQVGPLKVQAEKTKKYLVLADRLKLVQVNIFIREADKYEKELAELKEQLDSLNSDISAQEGKKESLNLENQKNKDDLAKLEAEIQKNAEDIAEKRSEREKRESDITLYKSQAEHISGDINRIEGELSNALEQKKNKEDEIVLIKTKIRAKELNLENQNKAYNEKKAEFALFEQKVSESEEQVSAFDELISAKMEQSNDLKIRMNENSVLSEQNKKRLNEIDAELDGLEAAAEEKNVELQVLEKRFARVEEEGRLISAHIDEFTKTKDILDMDISAKTAEVTKLSREINEKNSRLKIISELEREYEGYYGGVKAILKQRDNKNPDFRGICGAVGEVITLEKQFETAIETALGAAVQNIITRNDESVKTAIRYLKESKSGRATFLPMTSVKGRPLGNEKHNILKENGVIGIAKELIKYSQEYENIMSNLLDRVIVVDNIDNGTLLAKKTNHVYKIVTLDGEIFNPGGSVTGGSINKKSTGIFSRGREIAELKESLKTMLETQRGLNDELDSAKQKLENVDYKLEEAKEELQELAKTKIQEQNNLDIAKHELNQLGQRKTALESDFKSLESSIKESETSAALFNEQLSSLDKEISDLYTERDKHRSIIRNDRETRENFNNEIMALRLEIKQLENDVVGFNGDIERINGEIDSILEQNKAGLESIEALKAELESKKGEIEQAVRDVERLKREYDEMNSAMQSFGERKAEINTRIDNISTQITDCIETISMLNTRLTKADMRNEDLKQKNQQLYDSMWEDYEITYVEAKNYEQLEAKDSELQKEDRSLRAQIRSLGSVNVNAVEEYNRVQERFDFLTNQRNDIIESEEKLTDVIARLEELMVNQFREQFKIISENFTKVFRVMFGGGNAELKLADDDDILNCGIDINAQPPGKALQNMMLLSGGEKALTAMSLLFAILEMKPSPFCILDEIEAALDDANVNRYADYLKRFTDTTQFVVISHRKGTMEAADILYGVTMQEQGISKLVSVDFSNDKGAE